MVKMLDPHAFQTNADIAILYELQVAGVGAVSLHP